MRLINRSVAFEEALHRSHEDRKNMVTRLSVEEGLKSAAVLSTFWLPPAYYYGFGHSPRALWLRAHYPSYTARLWLTIFPLFLAFLYESHEVATKLGGIVHESDLPPEFPVYQTAAQFAYDHPFKMLTLMGVPTMATVVQVHTMHPELKWFQKLTHPNVAAQSQVFTALATVLAIYRFQTFHERYDQ